MTPGQEALAEAARLEAARVYARTVTSPSAAAVEPERMRLLNEGDVDVAVLAEAGQSVAAIALRLGVPRDHVRESLARLASVS